MSKEKSTQEIKIEGIALRDWFAGLYMANNLDTYDTERQRAIKAYVQADAMLAERKESLNGI